MNQRTGGTRHPAVAKWGCASRVPHGLVLQPDFVIIPLIAGLGPHLGTAELPAQPASADAARRRSDTPSTGCAGRERARQAAHGRVGPVGEPVIIRPAPFPTPRVGFRAEPLITVWVALRSAERAPRGCGRVPDAFMGAPYPAPDSPRASPTNRGLPS
jgi:hypothetical protein